MNPACYRAGVEPSKLSPEERAWVERDELRWRRAHAIVARHPELDVTDVYHTIVNMERTPAERLARGLRDGPSRTGTA